MDELCCQKYGVPCEEHHSMQQKIMRIYFSIQYITEFEPTTEKQNLYRRKSTVTHLAITDITIWRT